MKKNYNPFNKLVLPELDGPSFLTFGTQNKKLIKQHTATFSLPAGYTCPGARDCLAWYDREDRKLYEGPDSEFRCYAASTEAARPSVATSVARNLAILKDAKTTSEMASIIDLSLPPKRFFRIRVHADGDFYNQSYFLAWVQVAADNPARLFYAYTKSLPIWLKFRACVPDNLVLTASRGGKFDALIEPNGLRNATVVYHPDEAAALGLEIDHDDSHARDPHCGNFALLIHGPQAPGSKGSEAQKVLREQNIKYSYS